MIVLNNLIEYQKVSESSNYIIGLNVSPEHSATITNLVKV